MTQHTARTAQDTELRLSRDMEGKLLLSVPEAASILSCGRTYLYGLILSGQVRALKLGRLTRIPYASLASYVERQLVEQDWTVQL